MLKPLPKSLQIKGRRYVTELDGKWYFTSWGWNWRWKFTSIADDNIKHGARVFKQSDERS